MNLKALVPRAFSNYIIKSVTIFGAGGIFLAKILRSLNKSVKRRALILEQMKVVGLKSLPLVAITSLFVGAVTAVQAAYQFMGMVPNKYLGAAVGKAVVIELGPVITGLVVAGRVSAAIAAELGTMKVTEQIDALEAMAVDPIEYLVLPRVAASTIMLPVLTIYADVIAIFGGLIISVIATGLEPSVFLMNAAKYIRPEDILGGTSKSVVFGFLVALSGCFYGMRTVGGAEGVGKATTGAVVSAMVSMLLANFVLAQLIFNLIFRLL